MAIATYRIIFLERKKGRELLVHTRSPPFL